MQWQKGEPDGTRGTVLIGNVTDDDRLRRPAVADAAGDVWFEEGCAVDKGTGWWYRCGPKTAASFRPEED